MTKNQEWETYLYEQGEATEEPMALLKALRLAAGLTQQELSVATGIYPGKITDAERDIRALNEDQWERIQLVCDDRIKIFKRDAGLTIKLG
jgi:transcriptional regulator with XRE-family HTH domain